MTIFLATSQKSTNCDKSIHIEIFRKLYVNIGLNLTFGVNTPYRLMAKKPDLHPYSDKQAFERLMLLIATLVQYPGVGGGEPETPPEGHRDALQEVQTRLREVAATSEIFFPEGYPATPTIRKDLETLRNYGILERRMYRWGYYLGTGALSIEELRLAFHALSSQAKYQGNPQARRVHETLAKRLRGLDLDMKGEFFYPVYQHFNRAIVHTDPEEMMRQGETRHNLFHQLDTIETAILAGQALEIYRSSNPFPTQQLGMIEVWPLQLIYHDIAWYLIYEYRQNGQLEIGRLDRFKEYCHILNPEGRGVEAQRQSLAKAHKLLETGWGLYLGQLEEQQQELAGNLEYIQVKVRFYPPMTAFILEGERRHPKQKIRRGAKDAKGNLEYVDYTVPLPPRSHNEFFRWLCRYMDNVKVIFPPEMVVKHREAAGKLRERYGATTGGLPLR